MEASDVRHLLDFGTAQSERLNTGAAGYVSELLTGLRTRRNLFCVLLGLGTLLVLVTLFADRRRVDPEHAGPRPHVVR